MSRLKGKVALITGAGGMRGVGRATALRFAAEGADVALTDLSRVPKDLPPDEVEANWRGIESVAEEVEARGVRAFTTECDLCERGQISEMVGRVVEHFGRIDILVNNARAIMGHDKVPVTELPDEVWDRFLGINTTAVFLCTKHVARQMVRQAEGEPRRFDGRILNVGSDCSKVGRANGAAYVASKFAVVGLTQAAAMDLAPYGITVNAVCPGPINTNRLSYWERAQAEERGIPLAEFRAQVVQESAARIPLGRIAEPEDVANLLTFLASDEGAFITGQAYNVNGGQLFH